MPKGKHDGGKKPTSPVKDEEDVRSEAGTAISSGSETQTITLDDGNDAVSGDGIMDFSANIEQLEEKLKEALENAVDTSVKTRETALAEINLGLERCLLSDFIADRQVTFTDIVERSLRRGKSLEQILATRLAALVCIQLGPDCGEIYTKIRPLVLSVYTDASVAPLARAGCAEILGVGSFIADDEPEVFADVLRQLSKTFASSYLNGKDVSPVHTLEVSTMYAQTLRSWSLLMSVASEHIAVKELELHCRKLPELLETGDVDFRIAAGETIALMNEVVRETRVESSKLPNMDALCTRLRELSTESTKHRAKKDKKQQRSSFRNILHSIEDDDGVYQRIRFGTEVLDLHTWREKHQYEAFCSVLRTGMNYHLRKNPLIRQVFDLGEPLNDELPAVASKKGDKFQRQLQQTAINKERTLSRNVHRGNKQAGKVQDDDD